MSKDYGEMEREFVAGLKAETGKDLDEWLAAVAAQGLPSRNDTIDWLRRQGFAFARASWIERIQANGGKLIYADDPARPQRHRRAAATDPADDPEPPSPVQSPHVTPAVPPAADADETAEQIAARAKGYLPLYRFLVAEIDKALPGARIAPHGSVLAIARPAVFAAIDPGPKGLRLALSAVGTPPAPAAKVRAAGLPPELGQVIVLTDARQVNAELMDAVVGACARVNG
jgi:hypothetical protein